MVLTDLQKWKSLKLLHQEKEANHYKTIQDIHLKWSKLNLYEKTYKNINQKHNPTNFKKSKNYVLFIDSSNIYNKNGVEKIGYGQNPKKKESRISAICDENKNIQSLVLIDTIQKTEIKKTMPHDSKTIEQSLKDLTKKQIICKTIQLVGDKGYTIKKEEKLKLKENFNTEIVYPNKKNQKTRTLKRHKKLLKKRYVIENVFQQLKKYDRICMRKDKLECTYMGFLYLATIINFKKSIKEVG